MMTIYSNEKMSRCTKRLEHDRDRKVFMISLDKELDRINKTMHVVDKIYSGNNLSHCITSSEADRKSF